MKFENNIVISEEQLKLIENQRFILLKQDAANSINKLLSELSEKLMPINVHFSKILYSEIPDIQPKISRGENYLGMPFQVLDYPRVFQADTIFAFRTLFLWGNFFSFTFHISGKFLNDNKLSISEHIASLKNKEYFFCVNNTPWEYHYEESNYISLDKIPENEIMKLVINRDFIKLSRKIELGEWKNLVPHACETYTECMNLLKKSGS